MARFVLRARRVGAHSLVRDREALAGLMEEGVTVRLTASGTALVRRSLPPDEEVFESLAARVRPLILGSEPIYFEKVLDALGRLMDSSPSVTASQRSTLDELKSAWVAIAVERGIQVFGMQVANLDGSDSTGLVSDAVLAQGWMYADLVHADATGWKRAALGFPLRYRYAAAARFIPRVAGLTMNTLQFVEQLQRAGVVVVDQQIWDEAVVVGAAELVDEDVSVYVSEPDTEVSDLMDPVLGQPGSAWAQLTITEGLRGTAGNQVRVELTGADGTLVAAYDAAVARHERDGDVVHWHVLVADSLIIELQLHTENGNLVSSPLQYTLASTANRSQLAANTFLLEMQQAQTLMFLMQGEVFLQGQVEEQPPEVPGQLRANVELLEDVVGVEECSGQEIEPFTRQITTLERVRLRQAHLLWRGKVVQWSRRMSLVVSVEGDGAPAWGRYASSVIEVGGSQVAMPEVFVGHPEARWDDQGSVPDSGPDAHRFTVTVPVGVWIVAWSPQTRQTPSDEPSWDGEPWDITGIDQGAVSV